MSKWIVRMWRKGKRGVSGKRCVGERWMEEEGEEKDEKVRKKRIFLRFYSDIDHVSTSSGDGEVQTAQHSEVRCLCNALSSYCITAPCILCNGNLIFIAGVQGTGAWKTETLVQITAILYLASNQRKETINPSLSVRTSLYNVLFYLGN